MEITGAMKSIVECPICLQIPNGEVFLCENSHKVCAKCFYKLEDDRCPQGHCEYRLPEPFRYVALKELIENCFEVGCNNDGCRVVLKAAELRIHEEECPRRLISCFLDEDCDQVALEDMPDHLIDTHGSKFFNCGEVTRMEGSGPYFTLLDPDFPIEDICATPIQFSFDGHRFFYTNAILDNVWFMWLSVNAGKRVAERYKVTLCYKKPDSPFRVQATVQVLPVDVYWKEVLKSGHCLMLNAAQVLVLMTEDVDEDYSPPTKHKLVFSCEVGKIEC